MAPKIQNYQKNAEEFAEGNNVLQIVYVPPAAQTKVNFILLHISRVLLINQFLQSKPFSNMTEVLITGDDGKGCMESNKEANLWSLWKFCSSITIQRSEVVFLCRQFYVSFL